MRLADFIVSNLEPILAEWETFARTHIPAGEAMDVGGDRPAGVLVVWAYGALYPRRWWQ